jgi:hypothetical protein
MPYLGENTPATCVLWECSYLDLQVFIGHLGAQQELNIHVNRKKLNAILRYDIVFFIVLNG